MHLSRFRPQFTVRRLMIAVAIAGVSMGLLSYGRELRNRSATYQGLATEHLFQSSLKEYWTFNGTNNENYRRKDAALRAHHEQLRLKYEHAARYPWLPVAPDPPEPK